MHIYIDSLNEHISSVRIFLHASLHGLKSEFINIENDEYSTQHCIYLHKYLYTDTKCLELFPLLMLCSSSLKYIFFVYSIFK